MDSQFNKSIKSDFQYQQIATPLTGNGVSATGKGFGMLLDKMKLTHQLGTAFVLITAIGILVSVLATFRTNSLAVRIDRMASGPMANVELLTSFSDSLHTIDRNSQNYVITWDLATRAKAAAEINKSRVAVNATLEELKKNLSESSSQKLLANLSTAKDQYFQSVEKVLKMANEGAIQGAGQLLVGDVSKQQLALSSALNELRDLQKLSVSQSVKDAEIDSQKTSQILLGLAVLVAFFCIGTGFVVARRLGKATGELLSQMRKIAAGDLCDPVTVPDGNTEVALMLGALNDMQQSLLGVVSSVRSVANGVVLASSEIAQGNANLSDRTEQQASALEETAASMEDLNNKVAQNAEHSEKAYELSRAASETAKSGGEVVDTVIHTMREISESSQRIAEIINVINAIAFQTNILALNAAVEAARAGEQGRGFAVVASEVRTLAGRSAEAAKQINELITTNVERVERGTDLADVAGKTMNQVVQSIQRVTELMVEISAASREQSLGVGQVSEAISQMDTVTQQNAALVEQMAAAAASLKGLAEEQVRAVSVFALPLSTGGIASDGAGTALRLTLQG